MSRTPGFILFVSAALALAACSADTMGPGGTGGRRDSGMPPGPRPESSADACTNGIDDDMDGNSDCAEPDCAWLPACGGGGDAGMMSMPDAGFTGCDGIRREAMNTIAPIDI